MGVEGRGRRTKGGGRWRRSKGVERGGKRRKVGRRRWRRNSVERGCRRSKVGGRGSLVLADIRVSFGSSAFLKPLIIWKHSKKSFEKLNNSLDT